MTLCCSVSKTLSNLQDNMCRKTGAMGLKDLFSSGNEHVVDEHYTTILYIKALLARSHSQLNHPTHIVHISSTTGYEPGDLPEALLLPMIPSVHQSQTISLINLIAQITKNPSNRWALLNLPIRSNHYNSSRNLWRLESPTENPQWHCSPRCTNKRSISSHVQPLESNLIHQRPLLKSHSASHLAKPSPAKLAKRHKENHESSNPQSWTDPY